MSMAYPYYNYSPYQPTYYTPQVPQYQQQQYQPQIQQPAQQSYSPAINQSGIIWISGESEAAMFPVGPNNAVVLWTKDGKTIYLKSADATGKPSMKVYDLVERAETASNGQMADDAKTPAYATKEDLGAVVGAVRAYDDAIKGIKSEIESMKGDLYGVAGKRRARKQEQEDE